jgi:Zn-dependent proteases
MFEMQEQVISILLSLPVILIALTFHEVAHGYAAYKLGDPTARSLGRLSLNPLKHLDPIGCLCMFVFKFGWAKPVPVNSRYFKKPRRDMAITALAGPVTNLLLALFGVLCFCISETVIISFAMPTTQFAFNMASLILTFFTMFFTLNISLAVFNLLPIPPLDGSRILLVFLPPKLYFGFMKYERYISIIILICLWTGILSTPLRIAVNGITDAMFFIVRLLPLL